MALFLVFGLILARFWFTTSEVRGESGILGGPSVSSQEATQDNAALAATPMPEAGGDALPEDPAPPYDQALLESGILEANLLVGGTGTVASQNVGSVNTPGFDSMAYFAMPTVGYDYGKLHPHNAVDIANSCGTPVDAAAEGLVTDLSLDSWSGGYGHYVILSHPNGTETRYAHLGTVSVSLGDYVKQGDALGLMGRTGDATGCHLHFEIEGAANPFVK